MDKVCGLKTYLKPGRKNYTVQQKMDDILFAEKAFTQTNIMPQNVQNDVISGKEESKPIAVETARRNKKGTKSKSGQSRMAKLKTTGNRQSQPSDIGRSFQRKVSMQRQLLSLSGKVMSPHQKVKDWIQQTSCIPTAVNDSDTYPSIEVMRKEEQSPQKQRLGKTVQILKEISSVVQRDMPYMGLIDEGPHKDFFAGLRQVSGCPFSAKKDYIQERKGEGMASSPSTDISEAATATDSRTLAKIAETTPKHATKPNLPEFQFKKPFKSQRRGNLEPRHSSRLFTTGFVEVEDAFSQLSAIQYDNTKQIQTAMNSQLWPTEVSAEHTVVGKRPHNLAHVKTSTPKKAKTDEVLASFEFEISSVRSGSDDDLLQFHKSSREVNSGEILSLTDTTADLPKCPVQTVEKEVKDEKEEEKPEESIDTSAIQSAPRFSSRFRQCKAANNGSRTVFASKGSAIKETVVMSSSVLKHDNSEGTSAKNKVKNAAEVSQYIEDVVSNKGAKIKIRDKASKKAVRTRQQSCLSGLNGTNKATIKQPVIKSLSLSTQRSPKSHGKFAMKSPSDEIDNTAVNPTGLMHCSATQFDVCTLMNGQFVCPAGKLFRLQSIENNSTAFQDFIQTIPFDNLL